MVRIAVRRFALVASLALCLTAGTASARAPQAAVAGTFRTSIVIANPGTTTANVTIPFRDAAGNRPMEPLALQVAGGSSTLLYLPNEAGLPTGRYSAQVQSDQYVTAIANLYAADVKTATAYNAPTAVERATTLYSPLAFADANGYKTAIVVHNGANTAANVTIQYRDQSGVALASESRAIPAFSSATFDQTNTPNLGAGFRSAVVTADQAVTGVLLMTRPDSGTLGAAQLGTGQGSAAYMPVVYNGYFGFSSRFAVQNADTAESTFTAGYFSAATGQSIGAEAYPATGPFGVRVFYQYDRGTTQARPRPGFNGSAAVVSNETRRLVALGEVLSTASNYEMYNGVPVATASTRATCPAILKNYYGYNTSLTIQNVGTGPTDLTIVYTGPGGVTALTQNVTGLPSGANHFSYTPGNATLPAGFSGAVTVTSTSQRIVAMVNELLGTGSEQGDQLFTYRCDNTVPGAAGAYIAYLPILLQNAPLS